ncbi:Gfo/Idh/MocA family oxidoreductase [Chitinophaga pollutisoli]|uniref:Gfo/Idh/MocA family oxidoreductase n=1 Tax=Chitinophaga pollutisoli TaxID=3133966 RepID=A0ABZ2YYM7_9BACT
MITPAEKVKFAVVGCGHIGKRHAEMIKRNPESELVAMVDVKEKSALGIDSFEVPLFSSIEDLLSSDIQIDVVNIATPNGFHAEHALAALDARKHIVVEKPMALTKLDAEKVIYKALHVHKHVFAVMQNRYSPPHNGLKTLLNLENWGESSWFSSIAIGTATTAITSQTAGMEKRPRRRYPFHPVLPLH